MAERFLNEIGLLAIEAEGVEGVAEVPAAADAFLIEVPAFNPRVEMEQRNPLRQHVSKYPAVPGGRSASLDFRTLLKGSGVAGTAPEFSKLFAFCKFSETNVASVVNIYDVIAFGDVSATMAYYYNNAAGTGKKIIMPGARGNWKMDFEVGKPCYVDWAFMAADFTETDSAPLAGLSYDTTSPLVFMGATLAVDGITAEISKLSLDGGNQIVPIADVNKSSGKQSYFISKVEPVGSFDPLERLVATHNLLGKLRAGTEVILSLRLGTVAGNIVNIYCQNVQYMEAAPGEREGIRIVETNLQLNRNGGTGAITAFADGGGGKVIVTSAGHERGNGAHVTQSGTTSYNGDFIIDEVTASTYEIVDTWVADDATGTWAAGESHINISFE